MLKAIAFGLAVGAGVQAWRQWPADGPVTARAGILIMVLAVLAAYLGGRWHGRGMPVMAFASARAKATAKATAQATQTVQVAVVVPGAGAGAQKGGGGAVRVPLEDAPWFEGARREISADELDGIDVSDWQEMGERDQESAW